MTDWTSSFYEFQHRLMGAYDEPIHPYHHAQATRLSGHLGGPISLLELGAGGGQFAVAAALQGFSVTALELRESGSAHTRELAAQNGVRVETLTGDFYTISPGGPYEAICYWDGFGIGSDAEQRHLLGRIGGWLAEGGAAYIEVYTPWYWAQHAGFRRELELPEGQSGLIQTYGFDADACRMTDTYAPYNEPAQTQSLRCYSPADLRLLLAGTGLKLAEVWPGGRYDTQTLTWHPEVPLGGCQSFVAVLKREG
ncbi:class I SAM-dependent methyltransferase [Deinococcus sp.]|uniref:class I SAM-dependent methyltransferase n=1 Tax=Deinococcus sp. TaxID=47478 RepID=UPI003B5B9DC0